MAATNSTMVRIPELQELNEPEYRDVLLVTDASDTSVSPLGKDKYVTIRTLLESGIVRLPSNLTTNNTLSQWVEKFYQDIETLNSLTQSASQTRAGILRFSTSQESRDMTRTDVALSPKSLTYVTASKTEIGLLRIATDQEVILGNVDDATVTPNGLSKLVASTNRRGLVQRATSEEVGQGNDDEKYITARTLAENRQTLTWGSVQITGYLNDFKLEMDYTVPDGCVMVGMYSYFIESKSDRRFRIRFRSLGIN